LAVQGGRVAARLAGCRVLLEVSGDAAGDLVQVSGSQQAG
jgi:hypothetical protein